MVDETRLYKRYNNLLKTSFFKYLRENQNYRDLTTDEKILFLEKLGEMLGKSAAINKRMPSSLVPAKKVYIDLYKLLVKGSFLSKSYLEILKTNDIPKIKAKEMEINFKINEIVTERYLITKDTPILNLLDIEYYLKTFFKEITNFFMGQPMNICKRLALVGLLVLSFNSTASAATNVAYTPFVSNQTKVEYITSSLQSMAKEVQKNTEVLGSRTIFHTENFDANYHKNGEESIKWLTELGILDIDLWRQVVHLPPAKAGDIIKDKLKSQIGDFYDIKSNMAYQESNASDVVDGMKYAGDELNLEEFNRNLTVLVDGFTKNSRQWEGKSSDIQDSDIKNFRSYKFISCNYLENGDLLITIRRTTSQWEGKSSDIQDSNLSRFDYNIQLSPKSEIVALNNQINLIEQVDNSQI